MEKSMKRLLAIIVFSFFTVCAFAQEDSFCTWTNVTFDKPIGRWSVGMMMEYRHKFHEGVSKTDQFFVRPRFSYSALKWLKLGYQFDIAQTSAGTTLRFLPDVTFSKKVGNFSFAFRQRFQTTWKVEQGTNSTVLRSRAKVDYRIPETPVSVHFAIEPYWCDFSKDSFSWFQKTRWYAGFDIKIIDGLTLRPEYLCMAYHNHKGLYPRRTYDDHIFYMTFAIKL
jgi:hypothetical protein